MKKIISLQIDDDLLSVLSTMAKNDDRTLSSFIRTIIIRYLNEQNKKYIEDQVE